MKLRNKKVLVTGADGFIGSHLVEALLEQGCDIRALVYYNSFNSWGWLDTVDKKKLKSINVVAGDVRDANCMNKAVRGRDVVFHLAALIGIPFSYRAPDSYIDTNIKGTANILQACIEHKIEKVIVTSTSEVYGTAQYVPIGEEHPLQGQSPYSASKIGADKIVESFYRSFDLPVVLARPFNTYGPRQSARAVIPTIITQALARNAKNITLGTLTTRRDMNYVSDICSGFIALAKSDKTIGRAVNICSGQDISVKELACMILRLMGSKKKIVLDAERIRPEKSEVKRLLGDNRLICSLTGWQPKTSLEDGLKKTIEWFKLSENKLGYKEDIYNI